MQLLILSSGIIIGILISIIFILVSKNLVTIIQKEIKPFSSQKKAEIIKKEAPVDEFLNNNDK